MNLKYSMMTGLKYSKIPIIQFQNPKIPIPKFKIPINSYTPWWPDNTQSTVTVQSKDKHHIPESNCNVSDFLAPNHIGLHEKEKRKYFRWIIFGFNTDNSHAENGLKCVVIYGNLQTLVSDSTNKKRWFNKELKRETIDWQTLTPEAGDSNFFEQIQAFWLRTP